MTMRFAENEVRQITEDTWRIVLGEELEVPAEQVAPTDIEDSIAAYTQIAGDWLLAVVLYCSIRLARHVASVMFGACEADMNSDDIHDAMSELINIVSGNIKSILSGSSRLALAKVVEGDDVKALFPCHILLSEVNLICGDEPIVVMLVGEDKLAPRKDNRPANDACIAHK